MSELEISIKLAELSAQVAQTSLLSDVVKVGIPSLIAIVSSVLAYKLSVSNASINLQIAKNNREFDEKIEQLKIKHENHKEYKNQSYAIIQELAQSATEIYNAANKYFIFITTKLHLKSLSENISENMETELGKEYLNFAEIFNNNHNKATANTLLIGDKEIESHWRLFERALVRMRHDYNTKTEIKWEDSTCADSEYVKEFELMFLAINAYIQPIKDIELQQEKNKK